MKNINIFIHNIVESLLSIVKVFIFSLFVVKNKKDSSSETAVVLANGPSINKVFEDENKVKELSNIDTLCVNYFYKSKVFLELKPKYYILAGSALWKDDAGANYKRTRNELYSYLAKNVDWEMVFLIPSNAKKYNNWKIELQKNKKITIEYYNITALEGFNSFIFFLYNRKLGMPRSHNVVGSSLMILLWKKYKKIGLLGVDHSWTQNLFVTEDNDALLSQPHFYDEKAKAEKMNKTDDEKNKRRLHEILHKFYLAFKSYFVINVYAKKLHAKIYNLTPNSFIDAFERKTWNEFFK